MKIWGKVLTFLILLLATASCQFQAQPNGAQLSRSSHGLAPGSTTPVTGTVQNVVFSQVTIASWWGAPGQENHVFLNDGGMHRILVANPQDGDINAAILSTLLTDYQNGKAGVIDITMSCTSTAQVSGSLQIGNDPLYQYVYYAMSLNAKLIESSLAQSSGECAIQSYNEYPSSANPNPTGTAPASFFASPDDEMAFCKNVSAGTASGCSVIKDANEQKLCQILAANFSQTCLSGAPSCSCNLITDSNLKVVCQAIVSRSSISCSTISGDMSKGQFCSSTADGNALACDEISNVNDRWLCRAINLVNPSYCSDITGGSNPMPSPTPTKAPSPTPTPSTPASCFNTCIAKNPGNSSYCIGFCNTGGGPLCGGGGALVTQCTK